MSKMNDMIITIATMKIKGFTDDQIMFATGVPREWINQEAVIETAKELGLSRKC